LLDTRCSASVLTHAKIDRRALLRKLQLPLVIGLLLDFHCWTSTIAHWWPLLLPEIVRVCIYMPLFSFFSWLDAVCIRLRHDNYFFFCLLPTWLAYTYVADVVPVELVMFYIGLLLVAPVSKFQSAVQLSILDTMPTTRDLATSAGSWMLFRDCASTFLALEDFAHVENMKP